MAETTQVSTVSLRDYVDRIRRLFGIAGDIRTSLLLGVQPVILADDLQRPGLATSSGRRFKFTSYTQAATTITEKYRFGFNCVLTRVQVSYTAISATPLFARLIPPNTADAGVTYAQLANAAWTENLTSATDKPLVERATNGVAGLGILFWQSSVATGAAAAVDIRDLHMPIPPGQGQVGSVLNIGNTGVDTVTNYVLNVEGYAL